MTACTVAPAGCNDADSRNEATTSQGRPADRIIRSIEAFEAPCSIAAFRRWTACSFNSFACSAFGCVREGLLDDEHGSLERARDADQGISKKKKSRGFCVNESQATSSISTSMPSSPTRASSRGRLAPMHLPSPRIQTAYSKSGPLPCPVDPLHSLCHLLHLVARCSLASMTWSKTFRAR